MFFLIAIVNLLVIPETYKKIISFYLHFFIIVIILKPVLNIMGNEVSTIFDSITFVDEEKFNQSVEYYQGRLGEDVKEFTLADIDKKINQAEVTCNTMVNSYELDEVLILQTKGIDYQTQLCISNEIGISMSDIQFEGGGQ
ncbi:MAG: stage III sporulation protein AF [Turicibacter sp.]